MKFVIIAFLLNLTACQQVHEKWPLSEQDQILELRNLQQIPEIPSGSNGNATQFEEPTKKKKKRIGKTLRQRQIEDYEALQALKMYLNYDQPDWDFSFTTHGIFRFGLEFFYTIYFIVIAVYAVLILKKVCVPIKNLHEFEKQIQDVFAEQGGINLQIDESDLASQMFVLNQSTGVYSIDEQYLNGMISGIWKMFDSNGDNFLTRIEFRAFIQQLVESSGIINQLTSNLQMDNEALDNMFDRVDISKDGTISKLEMSSFLLDLFQQIAKQKSQVTELNNLMSNAALSKGIENDIANEENREDQLEEVQEEDENDQDQSEGSDDDKDLNDNQSQKVNQNQKSNRFDQLQTPDDSNVNMDISNLDLLNHDENTELNDSMNQQDAEETTKSKRKKSKKRKE